MTSMGMYGNSMPMYGMSSGMAYGMYPNNLATTDQGKGKGKSREADFEAAFAQVAASLQRQTPQIEEVKDDLSEALEKTRLDDGNEFEVEADFKKSVLSCSSGLIC